MKNWIEKFDLWLIDWLISMKTDISSAKDWYKKQRLGLERKFADDIKISVKRLVIEPYVHAIRNKKVRIAHPYIFPYSIHYYVDEPMKKIVIIGIVHNNRNATFLKYRV